MPRPPLFASDIVLAAELADCGETSDGKPSNAILERLKKALGLRFIGIDIGRHRDLTVATILEYLERKFYTRAVIRLASMPFKQQTAILTRILEFARPTGGCVDMTGVGLGLAEELSERIKIPAEAQLRASLQLPERSGKASGILYTPRSAASHADDFWSLAALVGAFLRDAF